MRNFVSKAAAIGFLLYSSELNDSQLTMAEHITDVEQVKHMAHTNQLAQQQSVTGTKHNELEHLMSSKFKELEDKISMEANKVQNLEKNLQTAKIDLETDQTMLVRHREVLENEKNQMDKLDRQVGVRAQLVDKIALKKQKQQKLKAAADRLVNHENEVRDHIQGEIMQRLAQETEDARRRGLIESVDDDEIRETAHKDAIRKNDQEELNEDVNEIEGMSKKLHKKHHHKSSKKEHNNLHHQKSNESLDEPATTTSSSHLVKKAANLKKEIKQMNNSHQDKKNHLHVKKNKAKKAAVSESEESSTSGASDDKKTEAAAMNTPEDADGDEPMAHDKDPTEKSKAKDADSLDDVAETGATSHSQKSKSKSIDETPKEQKKTQKKEAVKAAHKKEFKHQMELTSHIGEQLQDKPVVKAQQHNDAKVEEVKPVAEDKQSSESSKPAEDKIEQLKNKILEKKKEPKTDKKEESAAPVADNKIQNNKKTASAEHQRPASKKVEELKKKVEEANKKVEQTKAQVEKTTEAAKAAGVEVVPQSMTQAEEKVEEQKLDKAEFKELSEMATFGAEEDKAIAAQFDGEELVKSLGALSGAGISKDIKHAVPEWVSGKWGKKFDKKMKKLGGGGKEEEKEEKKDEKDEDKKEEKEEKKEEKE